MIKPPSQEELNFFDKSLTETGKSVILSLIPGFSDSFIPLSVKGIIPKPLTDLYKDEHLNLSYPELLNKCEEVYNSYSITSEMAKTVAKTQGQALSKIWFQQRSGASRLKAAVSTDITHKIDRCWNLSEFNLVLILLYALLEYIVLFLS